VTSVLSDVRPSLIGIGRLGVARVVHQVRLLSDAEAEAYLADVRLLWKFERSREASYIVTANASSFLETVRTIRGLNYATSIDNAVRARWGLEANRHLANFLTAFRLFDDHTRSRLSDAYGDGSRELADYVAMTKSAYDSSAAYRILWKLRNFVQHVGFAVQGVAYGASNERAALPGAYLCDVVARRGHLLLRSDDWGSAHADVEALPDAFPLDPMVEEVASTVRRLDTDIRERERPAIAAAAERIVALASSVPGNYNRGAVGRFIVMSDGVVRMSMLPPPIETLRWTGVDAQRIALPDRIDEIPFGE